MRKGLGHSRRSRFPRRPVGFGRIPPLSVFLSVVDSFLTHRLPSSTSSFTHFLLPPPPEVEKALVTVKLHEREEGKFEFCLLENRLLTLRSLEENNFVYLLSSYITNSLKQYVCQALSSYIISLKSL